MWALSAPRFSALDESLSVVSDTSSVTPFPFHIAIFPLRCELCARFKLVHASYPTTTRSSCLLPYRLEGVG